MTLPNTLRRVCIAPMIDCTDQYFRQFIRQITRRAYLYTEMITSHAILNGDHDRLLSFDPIEHPVALQVGGSKPADLMQCAALAEQYNYQEINLNVGCPSSRVLAGRFGACLMKEPETVARCVEAMIKNCSIPVTVKTRIGVDDIDSYQAFHQFIQIVANAGCKTFIVHARKAWLKGLSPKQNRTIPPLQYDFVHRLKSDFPQLEIIINGGITDLDANAEFADLDGLMIGREAYSNPWHLHMVDEKFFGEKNQTQTRREVLEKFAPFAERALASGLPVNVLLKHIFGLSHGIEGGSQWRRNCTEIVKNQLKSQIKFQTIIDVFPI